MAKPSARDKFQELLRELFQFESADLDFGVYRIMNQKRDVLEKFITEDLPARVDVELKSGAMKAQGTNAAQIEELAAEIRQDFGNDALDAEGEPTANVVEFPKVKQYLELRKSVGSGGGISRARLEADVYNHLYDFFRHYYDAGDFLSLRRYSQDNKYAIPYNGEEVYLHWANADQYYIKTGENFTDYTWTATDPDCSVTFKLIRAEAEAGNNKSKAKRFFLPQIDAVEFDPDAGSLVIPVDYRELDDDEAKAFGGGNKLQEDKINPGFLAALEKSELLKKQSDLKTALFANQTRPDGTPVTRKEKTKDVPVSRIAYHLRRYTRKNSSDYFIHKDLKKFLTRELDFYLKNEVLHLDTLMGGGEGPAEAWFQKVKLIRAVGDRIIEFLGQLEDFQKRLFEKKKFITECHWCFTLDRIPEGVRDELLPKIVKNDAQWEEWESLFAISEIERSKKKRRTVEFLDENGNLVLDTKFFEEDESFREVLLGAVEELDEGCDGVLVNGDNFHGLSILTNAFSEQIGTCFTDPPYNTGNDGFTYKDTYQHSSWLTMIEGGLRHIHSILREDGVTWCTLDEHESGNYWNAATALFGAENLVGQVAWQHSVQGKGYEGKFAISHNNVFCLRKSSAFSLNLVTIHVFRGDFRDVV